MEKRKFRMLTIWVLALIILVVIILIFNSLRRSSHVVLPDYTPVSSAAVSSGEQPGEDGLMRVEITPQTVQTAIETLNRPAEYVRTMTIERLWGSGSGTEKVTVTAMNDLMRMDTELPGGRVRHTIRTEDMVYIWYDSEKTYYSGVSGSMTGDEEQGIPTYEDVLELPPQMIQTADYRTFADENCIYVETEENAEGSLLRYWVSVTSGLLVGAERLQDGTAVYRMAAYPVAETAPTASDFTLPDGTDIMDK